MSAGGRRPVEPGDGEPLRGCSRSYGSPVEPGDGEPLRGGGSRSYGSLVRASVPPVAREVLQHTVQRGDTLQGLALNYGVTMEQIKRANRLYTNDSIFLKKSLFIPALQAAHPGAGGCPEGSGELSTSSLKRHTACLSERTQGCTDTDADGGSELSPMDFLKRMDSVIRQSKKAAIQGCSDGEKRLAAIEAACGVEVPPRRRPPRSHSAEHLAMPLTVTRLTKSIRQTEDQIFQL